MGYAERSIMSGKNKIREIHQAVSQGRLRDVQHLIDRKKLAFCRDHNGASPLHKAVIFGHQDIIEYLVKRYGGVIHIRDHGEPMHVKYVKAQTYSRWCGVEIRAGDSSGIVRGVDGLRSSHWDGVVVRRVRCPSQACHNVGVMPVQVWSSSHDHGSKLRDSSPIAFVLF
ncbi:ANK_REP_REGION domain-containing protein [Trichonephila clavipes]|nr:ANK_REP_REGION domain-containing protein [Trichonephila clavipes]